MNRTERSPLGRGGLAVGRHAFGAAVIGNLFRAIDDATAADALDAAWQSDVRYFDTAPHYGLGLSERRLGEAVRGWSRDEVIISTKVGRLLQPTHNGADDRDIDNGFDVPRDHVRVYDYSRDGVLRSIEASLTRLGLDRIDLVYVHDPDDYYESVLDGALPALDELRSQGVIRSYGAGMNQSTMLANFVINSDVDVVMLAGRYTLLDQSALDDLLPAALAHNVSVVAAGVFNSGLLARDRPDPTSHFDYATAPDSLVARATRIADICEHHGATLPQVAVQFALGHAAVPTVCLGARSRAQVERNDALFDTPVPAAVWAELVEAGLLRADAPTP
ncbi:aldo/keto reductase [Microcella sp.]|uniref:aldo/keto reductase n=1 Tax=Microcella sp. TaxID=1913979 RepID=UPI002560985A|nr:aldo/keto reductase [Microcella sp.]MBX9471492.1 aldo/keto reductase [Microcella sp.]